MYCPKCGTDLPDDSVFCVKCGNRVSTGTVPSSHLMLRPLGITILAVLDFIGGAFYLVAAGLMMTGDRSTILFAFLAVFLGIGVLLLLSGYGLWTLKGFGRIIQLVLAWIGLLGFPLLTIISILVLVYLYQPGIRILFSGKTPDQLSAEEIGLLTKGRESATVYAVVLVAVLLGALVFGSIIAAIAIPNFLNAVDRGKQKRTMADLRSIAVAVEEYAIDHNAYPTATTMAELVPLIQPEYIPTVPSSDGWGHPFTVDADSTGYMLCSGGKDGGECAFVGEGGTTSNFNDAIIFADGEFLRWPEGLQH